MPTEAQKRARDKWDRENTTVLSCKLRVEEAERFKVACAAAGTTQNAVLREAVRAFIAKESRE